MNLFECQIVIMKLELCFNSVVNHKSEDGYKMIDYIRN